MAVAANGTSDFEGITVPNASTAAAPVPGRLPFRRADQRGHAARAKLLDRLAGARWAHARLRKLNNWARAPADTVLGAHGHRFPSLNFSQVSSKL